MCGCEIPGDRNRVSLCGSAPDTPGDRNRVSLCGSAPDTPGDRPWNKREAPCGASQFAEPVTLSFTSPTDLRLAPTAARRGFVLVALRARRKRQPSVSSGLRQEVAKEKNRSLRPRSLRGVSQPQVGRGRLA